MSEFIKGNLHKKSDYTWDFDPTGGGGGSGLDPLCPNPYFDFSVNYLTSKTVFIHFNLLRYMKRISDFSIPELKNRLLKSLVRNGLQRSHIVL